MIVRQCPYHILELKVDHTWKACNDTFKAEPIQFYIESSQVMSVSPLIQWLTKQYPAFKKPLFKNESKPFSYIVRSFPLLRCQFLMTCTRRKLCVRKCSLFSPQSFLIKYRISPGLIWVRKAFWWLKLREGLFIGAGRVLICRSKKLPIRSKEKPTTAIPGEGMDIPCTFKLYGTKMQKNMRHMIRQRESHYLQKIL